MDVLEAKAELIAKITNQFLQTKDQANNDLKFFAENFFQRVSGELLHQIPIQELVSYLEFTWMGLQKKKKDEPFIQMQQLYKRSANNKRVLVHILNKDRSFIVDSILSYLKLQGIQYDLFIHPIIIVNRDSDGNLKEILQTAEFDKHPEHMIESYIFLRIKVKNDFDLEALSKNLYAILKRLYWSVDDWDDIKNTLLKLHDQFLHLQENCGQDCVHSKSEFKESHDLITWFEQRNFLFLAARYFTVEIHKNPLGHEVFCVNEEPTFGRLGLLRDLDYAESGDLTPAFARAYVEKSEEAPQVLAYPLIKITKTNHRSPIQRSSRMDSMEIQDIDESGRVRGIYQFMGIFTKESFNVHAFKVPVLKNKAHNVMKRFGLDSKWYDGKYMLSILDSIPRDEMFYLSEDDLTSICQNVFNMNEMGNVVCFTRSDDYGQYVTALVYMPRERYSFDLKDRFATILESHLGGKVASTVAHVGDLPFARLIYVLTYDPPFIKDYDADNLSQELTLASLSWSDYLERILEQHYTEDVLSNLIHRFRGSFEPAYKEKFAPDVAEYDLRYLQKISELNPINLYVYPSRESSAMKLKIFHDNDPLSLSDLLPILDNLGVRVCSETSYCVKTASQSIYIHDFDLEQEGHIDWTQNMSNFTQAFQKIWDGDMENDSLNQLILKIGMSVRQVSVLRAYGRFLQQIKIPFSPGYVDACLIAYPKIAALLVRLFETKFHLSSVNAGYGAIVTHIETALQGVQRLDHDRILRRFLNAIEATLRTNYFQKAEDGADKDYLSLKFQSSSLHDMPQPCPLFEIFICSTRVEATHLRGGRVARGGIRWSDRFEDFRTEVLGLMKAQMVKNSVIVPLGSKGGFVVKRSDQFTDRSELMKEVVDCYKIMMRGLLDITDNYLSGEIVRPKDVICYDDPDPYLVVAADKGTASFSDIANSISQDYGFWLDDAFASGGSAGYDHKKMAITSRGAWESVKRHFREMGTNVQQQEFTVIGVGDMAGDVFGNGMLRSQKIKLVAAFNHQHIFLDPTPDMQKSFEERQRLFNLPRSTWMDYDQSLISQGGGVYERSAKTIAITPEVRDAFGLGAGITELTPDQLVQNLLQSHVDLLWFGGIGTFVKASYENHADVGDMANNDVRVNAKDIRAKVIGEGANLGMTQRARVEYALKGGRINTDAIDNSAGVDCSDHEVNIKILFGLLSGKIKREERDDILREMTDTVADLVLEDNYLQTQILTGMSTGGSADLSSYVSVMRTLEIQANLNRAIEYLPDDEALERRRFLKQGMTRPELAVLLAYSKISLFEKLIKSSMIDDLFFHKYLLDYFPKILSERFESEINKHPLKREIIATVLANLMINRVGITFIPEMVQASGHSDVDIVCAFFRAIDLLGISELWKKIDALDERMLTVVQSDAYHQISQVLRTVVLWLLRSRDVPFLDRKLIQHVQKSLPLLLEGDQQIEIDRKLVKLSELALDQELAETIVVVPHYSSVVDIASHTHNPELIIPIASSYFNLRSRFGLDWMSKQIKEMVLMEEWQRAAQLSLLDDVTQIQSSLINRVKESGYIMDSKLWLTQNVALEKRVQIVVQTAQGHKQADYALLAFTISQIQRILEMA